MILRSCRPDHRFRANLLDTQIYRCRHRHGLGLRGVFRPLEEYVGLPILTVGVLCFVVFFDVRLEMFSFPFVHKKLNVRLRK
jgi:hypothetical protein